MVKRGVYIPEPPIRANAIKYSEYVYNETGQRPPWKPALDKLQKVYSTYAGEITGER